MVKCPRCEYFRQNGIPHLFCSLCDDSLAVHPELAAAYQFLAAEKGHKDIELDEISTLRRQVDDQATDTLYEKTLKNVRKKGGNEQ